MSQIAKEAVERDKEAGRITTVRDIMITKVNKTIRGGGGKGGGGGANNHVVRKQLQQQGSR